MLLFLAAMFAAEPMDFARWHETTPPGAPFTLDVPMGLEDQGERMVSGSKVRTWNARYGFMSVKVEFTDRPQKTNFTPRQTLEMIGGGLLKDWGPTATAKVTDIMVAGRPAAQLDLQRTTDTGSVVRSRLVRIRIGDDDDWGIQTTHIADRDERDVAHFWSSLKAPRAAPVLTPATIGRMTINAPGRATVTDVKLEGEAATTMEKWIVHAFEFEGKTKAWIYQFRYRDGQTMNNEGVMKQLTDSVVAQSNPKPVLFSFPQQVAGFQGIVGRGQAITQDGEEAVRMFTVSDGRDGWAMLAAGPNSARTEGILRDMMASIAITR